MAALLVACLVGAVLAPMGVGAAPRESSLRPTEPSPPETLILKLIDHGDYPAAESLAVASLESLESESWSDSLAIATVLDLMAEAMARGGRFWIPRARRAGERSLQIREQALGHEHRDVANSLYALGCVLSLNDEYEAAAERFERAVRIRERALGSEHPDVAQALQGLWWAKIKLDDCAMAESLALRAAGIVERSRPPDHPDRAEAAASLAYLEEVCRGSQDSTLYLQALRLTEASLGPEHPLLAQRLAWYSGLLRNQARYLEAHELLERALGIYRRTVGNNLFTARVLDRMGVNRVWRGDFELARTYFEQSLAMAQALVGDSHPDVARALEGIGDLLWRMGDVSGAIPRLERAVAIYENAPSSDHLTLARARMHLAEACIQAGDVARARPLIEDALATFQRSATGSMDHANCLHLLAQVTPDFSKRRLLMDEVAELYIKTPVPAIQGKGLWFLAGSRYESGDIAEAVRLQERALELMAKGRGPRNPSLGWGSWSMAVFLEAAGRDSEATMSFERAIQAFEQAAGPENWLTARAHRYLGEHLVRVGRPREALHPAQRANAIRGASLLRNARMMSERRGYQFASGWHSRSSEGLDLMLSLVHGPLSSDVEALRVTWDALIRSRAQILDVLSARHHVYATEHDSEVGWLMARFDSTTRRLANLEVSGPQAGETESFLTQWNTAAKERDEAERALAEKSVSFQQDRYRRLVGFDEVAGALPSSSALVGFARIDPLRVGARTVPKTQTFVSPRDPAIYAALVLRPDPDSQRQNEPTLIPLGEVTYVDSLVQAWRSLAGHSVGGAQLERAYRRIGAHLRAAIWDPIAPHLGAAKRVFVAPEGSLHFVNLASLPIGTTEYLVEGEPVFHVLSAERDLAIPAPEACSSRLLVLGAPDFDAGPESNLASNSAAAASPAQGQDYRGPRSSCGAFRDVRFAALPGSSEEVEEVADVWSATVARSSTPSVDRLVGSDATERAFKLGAPRHRVLHVATHGFFIDGTCKTTRPDGRGIGGMVTADGARPAVITSESPLLLSGLALAGANRRDRARPDEEDGILTADEIAALDLRGVEWAVLSACETGLGPIQTDEGILGLRRAFQVAGARTTIMSLWAVDDGATRAWMRPLYRARLVDGKSTADAVREASLAVLREQRRARGSTHPFTWGAFIATGDWR